MAKYSFNYSIDTNGLAKVTMTKAGIIFSKEAIEMLGSPIQVNIGIDKQKGIMGIRSAVGNEDIKAFDFATTEKRKSWIRIQSKPLLREIMSITKSNLDSPLSFLAKLDEDEGIKYLIIELKKK